MAKRQVYTRWISGNGLTLELHIPVSPVKPGARQEPWTDAEKQRIAQTIIDTLLQPLEAIEQDGLK